MKRIKILSLGLAAVLAVSMLAGCGSGNPAAASKGKSEENPQSQAEGKSKSTILWEQENVLYSNGGPVEFFETPWLNPGSFLYNKVLYGHLLFADENLSPVQGEGDLAKSYELSRAGKTLTFELRDGIYWHDGEPVTSEDMKWSIEYALKTTVLNSVFQATFEALSGASDYEEGKAEHIEGILADGNKLILTFDKAAPDALLAFTQFAPLPKKYLADTDPLSFQQAKFFQSPVGSGPFMVAQVQMNNYTTLKPFDRYYGGKAAFSIHLNPSAGDSDANFVTNAKAGKLDYAYTKNISDVKALLGTPGLTIDTVNVRYTRLFYLNKFPQKDGRKSPLADVRVRQAIAYALDMKSILDGVFEGAALPANSLTPDGPDKVTGLDAYAYNPDKARGLLKEAGWNPDTELQVVYYYTDQTTQDLMAIIQQYLADVGIKMNARLVEGDLAAILWKTPGDPVNGPGAVDWDMCYAAVAAMSLHDYYDRYQTGYPINSHTPGDPRLDELIAGTNSSLDPKAQRNAFFDLQKYENETLFVLPLYYQPLFLLHSDKIVKGAAHPGNPQFNYNWEIQNWELKQD